MLAGLLIQRLPRARPAPEVQATPSQGEGLGEDVRELAGTASVTQSLEVR